MLIDSHCHLDYDEFADLDNILIRAKESGVSKILIISTKISSLGAIMRILPKDDMLSASVGVHPLYVSEEDLVTPDELIALSYGKKVVAFGETGLDYYHNSKYKNLQKQSFKNHIIASQATNMPLIIHSRNACDDILEMLKSSINTKAFPGVIHCFTHDMEFAKNVLKMGFYISFSGIVTFQNSKSIQEVAKNMPIDRLLIETDAPYLAPHPHRGKVNEPSFVKYVAQYIAELRGLKYEDFCYIVKENFQKLFTKG